MYREGVTLEKIMETKNQLSLRKGALRHNGFLLSTVKFVFAQNKIGGYSLQFSGVPVKWCKYRIGYTYRFLYIVFGSIDW
jgi:hypothetical protein